MCNKSICINIFIDILIQLYVLYKSARGQNCQVVCFI